MALWDCPSYYAKFRWESRNETDEAGVFADVACVYRDFAAVCVTAEK
jgi:hypothetical protein